MSPDRRQHRGAHPADRSLFTSENLVTLRRGTAHLSWLLERGYNIVSSLKLVGDRYRLTARQRLAVSRAACSEQARTLRENHRVELNQISGEKLIIDGFNLLITIEAALGGGPLLFCRDDCIRDLASVHGSYRSVRETEHAIALIGRTLARLQPASVLWLLDRPVSNSGRLAKLITDRAAEHEWRWQVEVAFNPDRQISTSSAIAITSDSSILDRAGRWANLSSLLIEDCFPHAWLLDLRIADLG